MKQAEDKLGEQRTEELRAEIELLASDLQRLRAALVDVEDEP